MATYEGIAAYIATSVEGDTVVDLEMDIPAGWTLIIAQPKGHGGSARSFPGTPFLWIPDGNYYYITDVTDTQSNAWGYCMDAAMEWCGTLPTTIVTSPLEAGTDTITVTIARESGADRSDPAFVSRVLAFSGITAYSPNNGLPVAMQIPRFNQPFNGSFFTLDPDDAIPLPLLVAVQDGSPVTRQEIPFQEYPPSEDNTDPQFAIRAFAIAEVIPSVPSLYIASIIWDGTTPGWDYYYTTDEADPSPGFTVGPAPSATGLSADGGAFYFDAFNPDDGWVDLSNDTMGAALEARYAYLFLPSPPPEELTIGGDYDAATGVWGDSGPQVDDVDPNSPSLTPGADTSYPFAPQSWDGTPNPTPPPDFLSIYPLGDPNIIEAPVWPTMSIIEGIWTGEPAAVAGIYATVSKGGATTGTGTFDPDTMVGISHVQQRGGAT